LASQILVPNGEFNFTLKEKTDRHNNLYLFGAIHLFNCVIFVRPTGESGTDGFKRWNASVRPYTGQHHEPNPDDDVWSDVAPDATQRRKPR